MAHLTLRAHGPAPADEAWERYACPRLWSSWSPQISRVDVDADRLSTGVTGRVHSLAGVYADFTVDSWDETAREWRWTVRPFGSARLALVLEHGVTERDDGATSWLRLSGPLPLVLGYAAPARLALHRLVQS
jgi:hypothetical protein